MPLLSLRRDSPPKSSPTRSVRPRSSVGRATVDLIRRSGVRFPQRLKDFFFTSCGSRIPFTRANAQWVLSWASHRTLIYTSELIHCSTIFVNNKDNKTALHWWLNILSLLLRNIPHLNGKVMWTLVPFVLCGVSVFIRRQQLAPKLSFGSFGGGQVHRKARRAAEAFKGAIKAVVHGEWSNSRHIQIMELVFYKCLLSNSF